MKTYADKTWDHKSQAMAHRLSRQKSNDSATFQFAANRPEAVAQQKLQQAINNSVRVQQLKTYQAMADQAVQKKDLKPGGGSAPIQLRSIPNVPSLKDGIRQRLNVGDPSSTISKLTKNIKTLTKLYTPGTSDEVFQANWLAQTVGNDWREGWFDRVDQRVEDGSQRTIGDAQFWAEQIRNEKGADAVEISSIELLGDELHDAGLGPAKVEFVVERTQTPPGVVTAVIKPEDRSIEKAILGSGDSVATRLNEQVGMSRRVKTVNMDTDANHGTIMEFVKSDITSMTETVLRKLHIFESEDVVNVETIGFALLTGLYDLHAKNLIKKGGAPVLIDADVAARPQELMNGPSNQEGFNDEQTQQVRAQIGGDHLGSSHILQYAIDNPQLVTNMVRDYIGDHQARIVPVHTGVFSTGLQLFVQDLQDDDEDAADGRVGELVAAVVNGIGDSPGLVHEVGPDIGNFWNAVFVRQAITNDFNMGVIPHFQYQPSTGQVFLHNTCIWQGYNLAHTMAQLRARLIAAGQNQ